jgi:hypothetical protein
MFWRKVFSFKSLGFKWSVCFPEATSGLNAGVADKTQLRQILGASCADGHCKEEKPRGGVDLRLRLFPQKITGELEG